MSPPIRKLVGVVAVGVVGVALTTGPASAAPASETPEAALDGVDPGLLDALAAELGTDAEGAEEVLVLQGDAAEVSEVLSEGTAEGYAGSWLEESTGTVFAAVTTPEAEAAALAAGATPVAAERSIADLEEVVDDLAATEVPDNVGSWWVDVESNTVVVDVVDDGVADAEEFVADAGVPQDAISYATGVEAPETLASIRGGMAYYIGSGRCSVGFAVQGGFVTAGHCGSVGASTTYGTFQGSSFPGDDYAWVSTPGHDPVGQVEDYSGGTVAVTGSTSAAVGATVCRSGSTTGWSCGQVQAYNATVSYAEGTVTGLIRTSVCAEPGDSGGSLLAGNQAQGVTSGGSGSCRTGGTTFFQPVNEILDAYGLQLLTS